MPSKKKNHDYSNYAIKSGWVQEEEEGPLYTQGRNYSRQSYDEDIIASNIYPIFDDKQIKEALKGIEIKQDLSNPNEVHQHGAIIVPIFCQEGYGVNFVKEHNPDYSQLTPDRYKSIIKAVVRRGIRVLQTIIQAGADNSQYREKISNTEYNKIVTPLMHCEKRMPVTYRAIFYKLLKQAYGVGPSITKEEGKRLFTKLKEAANNKKGFFYDNQIQTDDLDERFRTLALKSMENREKISKAESHRKRGEEDLERKKKKSKKDKSISQYGSQIGQYGQGSNNESDSEDKEQSSSVSPLHDPLDENYHANNYWTARYEMSESKSRRKNKKHSEIFHQKNQINSQFQNLKSQQKSSHNKHEESENQSTVDELIWPDEVEFYMYELMIEKLNYKHLSEGMIKKYPQNTDYFTEIQLQQQIERKVGGMFKDITEKYSKVCLKESIVNEKDSSSSKPISLFLMLKSHYNKIYRYLMRSSSAKEPKKILLKLYLTAIKQIAATPGQGVNTMTFDVGKNDILLLEKELNAAFDKKINSENIKQREFNGDYDEALQTDTDDFTQTQGYHYRNSSRKFSNSRVNFDQEQKLFISELQTERDWNDPTKFDFLNEKNPYDDIGDKEKAIEDYLRQPVKKSSLKDFGEDLAPPVPRPRKSRYRKAQSSVNRRTNRAKSKGRTYKSIMKNPDILEEFSGSEFDEHDEYDWFHTQESITQAQKYGSSVYNDYGYDNRALVSSFKIPNKAGGSRHMLSMGRIIEEGQEGNGGVIEID